MNTAIPPYALAVAENLTPKRSAGETVADAET